MLLILRCLFNLTKRFLSGKYLVPFVLNQLGSVVFYVALISASKPPN